MAFTVVYDACVLYPMPLCDLLIRIAQTSLVRARWSEQILDECFRNLRNDRPDLSAEKLEKRRHAMNGAVRDALVSGHESIVKSLTLPDLDDCHVLAAAIRANAQVIVTHNIRDFPESVLAPFEVEAQTPDEFVLDLLDLRPGVINSAIDAQAAALRNPPRSREDVLEMLVTNGLVRSVAKLRELG